MKKNSPTFRVLAIESSCDETAAAIVEKHSAQAFAHTIASITATSLAKHMITKGIVPEVAAREQLHYMLPVLTQVLRDTDIDHTHIDAIAITTGPGLIGSLLVGIETARTLAMCWDLPLIAVNHVHAHPYANFLDGFSSAPPQFPILSWVISGGHTTLSLIKSHNDVVVLGSTVDDAVGECFDKCARVLGFDYPGGPHIERLARTASVESPLASPLPRPLLYSKDYRLSFSGLKTAFSRQAVRLQTTNKYDYSSKAALALELQHAITAVLTDKTLQALAEHPEVRSVIFSGGVAANQFITQHLQHALSSYSQDIHCFTPPLSRCTDNAEMIGAWAVFHPEAITTIKDIQVSLD